MMEECLHSITFSESDVIKIRALDVNKAHGHDNILVRIIELSITAAVAHLLTLIFQNSAAAVTQWKRASLVPIHKKNHK